MLIVHRCLLGLDANWASRVAVTLVEDRWRSNDAKEGRNVHIDIRWGTPEAEAMQRLAKELVAMQPDLIVTQNTPGTAAMLQQTRAIPIIFVNVVDPVG